MRDLLARYAEQGISRVMGLVPGSVDDDDALERFAEEARAAGVELSGEGYRPRRPRAPFRAAGPRT